MIGSELRLRRIADPEAVRALRHALAAFLDAIEIRAPLRDDAIVAVGEVLANAVEHAYPSSALGPVEMSVRQHDARTLIVDVVDRGTFKERAPIPGRGYGLGIARAVARSVTVAKHSGTHVQVVFDLLRDDATAKRTAAT